MPRTSWELELKAKGGARAKALARDLRDLDSALRSLGESSGVLDRVARDASALRGARVRISAERSVGDAHARQQQRMRTEISDTERMRRAVEAGQRQGAAREGAERLRAYQRTARSRERYEANANRNVARQNANAFARDQREAVRQFRVRDRLALQQSRAQERFQRQAGARERETVSSIMGGVGVAFGVTHAISAATIGALSTIVDMVSAVGQLTLGISSAVLEMVAFREASLTTLRAMARDNTGRRLTGAAADRQAREQFGFARTFARQTPLDVAQVIDLQRQTSAAGFTGARNREVVSAAADVGAFNPNDPSSASRFLLGLGQLRNASTVRLQDLRQTAMAAGLGENDILREIARNAGQTQRRGESDAAYNGRIQRMQQGGRFTGAQGVEGVLAALRARNGGALGSFARSQGGTLTGTLSNLRGAFLDFVTGIEDIENLPGIRALKDTLNGIVDVFTGTGPTAERLRRIFTSIVNDVAQFVADLGGGREGVAGLIERIVSKAEQLAPLVRDVVRAFGGAAWQSFSRQLGPLLEQLGAVGDDAEGTIAVAELLGSSLGTLLGFGVRVTAWLVDFYANLAIGVSFIVRVADAIMSVVDALREIAVGPWMSIGSQIVDGMREGWFGPSQSFVSDIGNWSNDIANASRANLGIHSPSKVFADIGSQIPAGMSLGIDSGAGAVERSLSGMVAPPSLPGFGALSGLAGMGGINAVFNITVNGSASNETGEAIGEAAWSAFVDRFEQANAMAGG